jgi:hypothetical protein
MSAVQVPGTAVKKDPTALFRAKISTALFRATKLLTKRYLYEHAKKR